MTRLLTGCAVCILAIAVEPSLCASSNENKPAAAIVIPAALQDYYYSAKLPERLSYSIDLWYDAALKGNESETRRFEGVIHSFLDNDIRTDEQLLSLLSDQISRAALNSNGCDSLVEDSSSNPAPLDRSALSQAWEVVNTKKLLQENISRASAFSNKYRLMGDYIELLRRELDLPRLKLASAANERNSTKSTSRPNGTRQD